MCLKRVLFALGLSCFGGDGAVFDATPRLLHCGLLVWKNWLPMLPHSEACLHKCTIWPLLCLYLPYALKAM